MPGKPRPAPIQCPGLSVSHSRIVWRDSLGTEHDLLSSRRLTPGEAAIRLRRSGEWVKRMVRAGRLYPVAKYNCRSIEIFEVGLADFIARSLAGGPR